MGYKGFYKTVMIKNKKKKVNYIDKDQLNEELKNYYFTCKELKEKGEDLPRISEFIGECIYKICYELGNKYNFARYSYKEEMISDGIENCIMYFENFDSNKTENPFAYFTQIIWWAFVRRITKEKTQQYVKYKSLSRMECSDDQYSELNEIGSDSKNSLHKNGIYDNMSEFIENFEKSVFEKKNKKPSKQLRIPPKRRIKQSHTLEDINNVYAE